MWNLQRGDTQDDYFGGTVCVGRLACGPVGCVLWLQTDVQHAAAQFHIFLPGIAWGGAVLLLCAAASVYCGIAFRKGRVCEWLAGEDSIFLNGSWSDCTGNGHFFRRSAHDRGSAGCGD